MDFDKAKLAWTWAGMLARCYAPHNEQVAKDYADRGIAVDERWHSFENFFYDMSPRPEGMSLDRIDNDKGYSKENCRWADRKTQANNRRSNVQITIGEETKNLAEWAEISGNSADVITYRIKAGWTTESAVFSNPYENRNNNVRILYDGKNLTPSEWSKITGLSRDLIYNRFFSHGWSNVDTLTIPVGSQGPNKVGRKKKKPEADTPPTKGN